MTVNDVLQVLNWLYQDPELSAALPGRWERAGLPQTVLLANAPALIFISASDFAWEKESSLVTQISLISKTALFGSPPTPQPSGVSLRLEHLYLSRPRGGHFPRDIC